MQSPPPSPETTFESFLAESPARHLLALAILVLVLGLRWPDAFHSGGWRGDERIYSEAFERTSRGESPYDGLDGEYIYPPSFAVAGAWGIEVFGLDHTLALFRAANFLGAVTMVWLALGWWPAPWGKRLTTAVFLAVLSPGIAFGLEFGNVSLAVGGTVVAGLSLWPKWPWTSGLLLGFGNLLKPLAVAALAVLPLHRPLPAWGDLWAPHRIAGGLGLGLSAMVLGTPFFQEFLGLGAGRPWSGHNVSIHRVLWSFHLSVSALVFVAGMLAVSILWVRNRPRAPHELLVLGVTTTLWTVPLVWTHTLLITLPLQVLALLRAADRARHPPAEGLARRLRFYEVFVVVCLAASVHLCGAVEVLPHHLRILRGLTALVPAVAPFLLALYVLRQPEPVTTPGNPT